MGSVVRLCALALAAVSGDALAQTSELVSLIEAEMQRRHIPGAAVAVLEGTELAWARGFGLADRESSIPVRADTPFMIGSTSKPFLSVALMQMVDADKLDIDDPVSKYVHGLGDSYERITLGQLASHTAGVPRDGKQRGPSPYINHQVYGEQLVAFLAETELVFQPSEGSGYSNLGPALMALAVEAVADQPIDEYLKSKVFEPLGMARTGHVRVEDNPRDVPDLATGYIWTGERFTRAGFESRFPTGSMHSTVEDLARFVAALRAGDLIRPESLQVMWTIRKLLDGKDAVLGRDTVGRNYGAALGWFVDVAGEERTVHHGGSMEGFTSHIDIHLGPDRTVIVLCNNESGTAADLAWAIREFERMR